MTEFNLKPHGGNIAVAVDNSVGVKAMEEFVLEMLAPLRGNADIADPRWAAIGFTDLEKGFMSLARACLDGVSVNGAHSLPEDSPARKIADILGGVE